MKKNIFSLLIIISVLFCDTTSAFAAVDAAGVGGG